VVGNKAPDGRGKCKAVPGAKGKYQPIQSGEAANEREIIRALGLQATPGVYAPQLPNEREKLAGGRPVSPLALVSSQTGLASASRPCSQDGEEGVFLRSRCLAELA